MFKTPVALSTRKEPIDVLLPVGLNISFDARSLRGDDPLSSEVPYQACAVFAGSWPKVPHPTLLPGGPGTYAPVYDGENTTDHTFYYLQVIYQTHKIGRVVRLYVIELSRLPIRPFCRGK